MSINAYFTTVGTSTWTVPSDWNNSNNTMGVIGGGGGFSCGGGGGFAGSNNVALTPGATVYVHIGQGATFGNGGGSWINIVTNAQPGSGAQGVYATGGIGLDIGSTNPGGAGVYGQTLFSGGVGQILYGPGGGAAGPFGNGGAATTTNGGQGDN